MIDFQTKITEIYNTPSDINEHFPAIIRYGQECNHITEMGVRWVVSTWGWLATRPKKLISYDLHNPSFWGASIEPVIQAAKDHNLDFEFRQADVLQIEIEETDLLFIDTWHTYDQLKQELELHSNKVKKYICFHDTTTFADVNEPLHHENSWGDKPLTKQGIWPAIDEFLDQNKKTWRIKEKFYNNNGFTIIERLS